MKKNMPMLMAFMVFAVNLYAIDNLHFKVLGNEYAAGIAGRFDLSYLTMTEKVYKDSSSGDLISAIDWNMGFQAAAGTGFLVEPADPFRQFGLSLEGMFLWHFPVNDRIITDTDWDEEGNKFSYGEAVGSAIGGMEAEGRLALVFPIRRNASGKYIIEPAVEVWYSRYAVMAHDGWTKQAAEEYQLYGVSMEYIQEWIVCAPALGFRMKFANSSIGVKIAVSPFVWGNHIDNHYFRKPDNSDPEQRYTNYEDRTKGGIYYKIQGGWFWNITQYVQTGVSVYYRAIENARGDTTVNTTGLAGYSFFDEGMAGAAVSNFGFGLTIRTTL